MKDRRDPEKKYILVVKEKHGDYYFDATGDKLYDAAFDLVKERYDHDWYPDTSWIEDIGNEPYTVEQLAELEEKFPDLYPEAQKIRRRWIMKKRDNNEIQYTISELDRILKEEDKVAAWKFLYNRSDYEYEYVELVALG